MKQSFIASLLFAVLLASVWCCGGEEKKSAPQVIEVPAIDLGFYQAPEDRSPLPMIADGKPRHVIFMIGDGLGLAPTALARLRAMGADSRLHMERMPVTGLCFTHSANALVTDSAAAGTALATGVKTNNGMIGQKPNGSALRTLLEMARGKGMSAGLVATSTISHATPASFASHVASRGSEADIALQLSQSGIEVLLGGGRDFWLPEAAKGKRKDNRDLIAEARANGYAIVDSAAALAAANGPKILGLFQASSLTTQPPEPSLADMTTKAIEVLQQDKDGFFLMVEGSQIDWKCHDNNAAEAVRQILLFDMAVKAALDFAQKDKTTLVIVTADHDTGGLTIIDGKLNGNDLTAHWSTKSHTPLTVPLYVYGPGAINFTGVQDNTEVPKKIAAQMGWELGASEAGDK